MKTVTLIGSGFSSLSAACYMAKNGYKVTLFEKNDTIGGRVCIYPTGRSCCTGESTGYLDRGRRTGDGEKGDDVTANVKTIRSIPLRLQGNGYPSLFEIRGEIH